MSVTPAEPPGALRSPLMSMTALRTEHTELLKRYKTGGTAPELVVAIEDFVLRGRALGTLLDRTDERIEAQRILDQWGTLLIKVAGDTSTNPVGANQARDEVDTTLEEFDVEKQPELQESDCPYAGVQGFSESENQRFFGRAKLATEWAAKLGELRLLLVVGPSGSGKSSLVSAGVVPALRAGAVPGSESWNYLPETAPGSAPIAALASLVSGGAESLKSLGERGGTLSEMLPPHSVICVQRFEELFTLCSEHERKLFLEHLHAMVTAPAGHRVILTMRNDGVTHLSKAGPLESFMQAGEVYARPFDAAELREFVEKPAEAIGLKFEDGLVDALIFDVLGDPAALLLLQFTLLKLWSKRQRNWIPLAAYRELGGGRAAFEQAMQKMLDDLTPEDQGVLRRVMLRLVRPALGREVNCTTVARASLNREGSSQAAVDRVLSAAKASGLVALLGGESGEQQVRVVHDALITKWSLLMEWVDEARGTVRQREQFTAAAVHWMQKTKDPGLLWRGAQLATAAEYHEPSDLEREFVAASLYAQTRTERRWRRLIGGAALAAVIAAVLALLHFKQGQRSAEQGRRSAEQYAALQQRSSVESKQELGKTRSALRAANVERGMRRLDSGDPAGAALWFAQLFALDPQEPIRTQVYRRRLETTLRQLPRLLEILPHDREANYAELSRDGKHVLTVTVDEEEAGVEDAGEDWARGQQTAWLWTLNPGAEPSVKSLGEEANFTRFSADGTMALTVHGARGKEAGVAHLWKVDAPENPLRTLERPGALIFCAFSPDGARAALVQERGAEASSNVVIWSLRDEEEPVTLPHDQLRVSRVSWSPTGERLATCGVSELRGEARIYDMPANAGAVPRILKHGVPVNDVVFSHDGTRALTASGNRRGEAGVAQLWNPASGEQVGFPLVHRGAVVTAQFSPDDRLIGTASTDATARLWSADTAREILSCPHDGWVYWLDFSPDGRFFATGSRDRMARVWDIASGQLALPPMNHYGTVPFVFFSADGQRLLTTGKETPRLWALGNADPPAAVFNTDGPVTAWALSSDGRMAATASEIVSGEQWELHACDVSTGVARLIGESPHPVTSIALSADGSRLAVGFADQENQTYRTEMRETVSGAVTAEVQLGGEVKLLTWNADGTALATVSRDAAGELTVTQVWDAGSGAPLTEGLNHDTPLTSVVFSANGLRLLTTGGTTDPRAGEANIWKVAMAPAEPVRVTHGEIVTCAAFSADGSLIVTGSEDNYAQVWDATTGEARSSLLRQLHSADQTSVAFHPTDNSRILTASYDQTAVVCEWATGKKIAIFRHAGVVQSAAFSPVDGSRVVTGSSDRTTRVWDVESNELIAIFKYPTAPQQARFSPDDGWVVALSYNVGAGSAAPSPAAAHSTIPISSSPDTAVEQPRRQVQVHTSNVAVIGASAEAELGRFAQILSTRTHSGDLLDTLPVDQLVGDWRELRGSYERFFKTETEDDFHRRSADAAEAAKQYSGAIWHLSRLLAKHPDDPALLRRRAASHAKLLQWKLALENYSAALQARPDDLVIRYERGHTAADAGEWAMAQEDCDAVVLKQSQHVGARLTLAAVHAQQAHWDEAAQHLQEISTPAPRSARHWQKLAFVQLRGGRVEDYRTTCAQMLQHFGSEPALGSTIGWPCVLGEVAGADLNRLLEIANKAVEDNPSYYRLNTLGAVLYRARRFDEAITVLDRSRKAYATATAARIAELRDDSFHASRTSLEQGRAVDWVFLAMAYFQKGDRKQAKAWLSEVAQTVGEETPAGVEISAARRLWNELELKLLYEQASRLIGPPGVAARD